MWRLVFFLFLLPAVSFAGTWKSNSTPGYNVQTGPRVVVNPLPPGPLADLLSGRTYNPDVTEGSVLLRDLLRKTPTGKGIADVGILLERKATGKALATAMARGLPVVGGALIVADVLDAAGCKISTTTIIECTDPTPRTMPPSGTELYVVRDIGWSPVTADMLPAQLEKIKKRWEFGKYKCTRQPYQLPPPGSNSGAVSIVTFHCAEEPGAEPQCGGQNHCAPATPAVGVSPVDPFTLYCAPPNEDVNGVCTAKTTPSPDQFGDRASNDPEARPKLPGLGPTLDAGGIEYDTEDPKLSGPSYVPGGRVEQRTEPDGSTITKDRDYPMEYSGPADSPAWYEWDQRETTRTWPPGTTPTPYDPTIPATAQPTPPGGSSSSGTTTVEVKTCGLPNTPACKIDESGTPGADIRNPTGDADSVFAAWKACILAPSSCLPALPNLNWAFTLPSTCNAIALPAFASVGVPEVNLCPFQSVFHDLMSMLWVAAGLFGAIRLVTADSVGS